MIFTLSKPAALVVVTANPVFGRLDVFVEVALARESNVTRPYHTLQVPSFVSIFS